MHRRLTVSLFVTLMAVPEAHAAIRYVAKSGSDNPTCTQAAPCASIQHTVTIATSGDSISIGPGLYLEHLGVTIKTDLTIEGAGIFDTRVSGSWEGFSVFTIVAGVKVTITGLQVRQGRAAGGGGIFNSGDLILRQVWLRNNEALYGGGGIFNQGRLHMEESEIAYNAVTDSLFGGGGIYNHDGGEAVLIDVRIVGNQADQGAAGVANVGLLHVSKSLIAANQGDGVFSGNFPLTLTNTTVSRNRGFGIHTGSVGRTHLIHVTVAQNGLGKAATESAAGLLLEVGGELSLKNTIVADNNSANCLVLPIGTGVTDAVGSLDSDHSCLLVPVNGNLPGADAQLGPLKMNGGFSQTHALRAGSPAIDTGWYWSCSGEDQRGVSRPVDGDGDGQSACDIGAFEYVPPHRER